MNFSAEQHIVAARQVRINALKRTGADRKRFIQMSNNFVVCAKLAARDRGGICLDDFNWSSPDPDWDAVELQISRLALRNVESPPLVPDPRSSL
jgi:hypothetical protein